MHQTHYEKSDWSRAFNQFTTACEPDMINAKSAADIAFIMSSSTSAWLLSPLECFSSETKWLNASLLFLRMNYVNNILQRARATTTSTQRVQRPTVYLLVS